MKRQRLVTRVHRGQLSALVRRQLAGVLKTVKEGTEVVIEMFELPTRRTLAQNDALHAMIGPWAKDEGHLVDELKRDLLGHIFGWVDSPLGETRIPLKPKTSELTIDEFSFFMERVVEVAADTGYLLTLPSEYTESKWMPETMKEAR